MVTSLLRFRSRHVCQNVLENTDPTLWKMKSLACFQNRQRTKQGTILPFIFHFPQFYSFQLLDSHHPNQMSPCPRFPCHIDHKIILFTPRKILSNLETHSQPFFFFKYTQIWSQCKPLRLAWRTTTFYLVSATCLSFYRPKLLRVFKLKPDYINHNSKNLP